MGYCFGDLPQLKEYNLNETEYLQHQMKVFLDQGNYNNEHLANITSLMDSICRTDGGQDVRYPISSSLDVDKYTGISGKGNRCKAIDEVMEAMYPVFKKVSWNNSEPLDFSVIQFYNSTDKQFTYNVTDLINTIWIKSDTPLDLVCEITNPIKHYAASRSRNLATDQRQASKGVFSTVLDIIDRLLDPILGLQKRLYWESNTRYEQVYLGLANQLGSLRDGFGKRYNSTVSRLSNMLGRSANSTVIANSTMVNSTSLPLGTRLSHVNHTASLSRQNASMWTPMKGVLNQTTSSTVTSK